VQARRQDGAPRRQADPDLVILAATRQCTKARSDPGLFLERDSPP
jgi:hypothetical protein